MKKEKIKMIVILVLFIMVLSIGYAYLNTSLTINGTTDVDANTWNVYWNNIQVTSGSVTGSYVTTAPTIDTNKTTVSFQVRLSKPGDFYEFTLDAKNEGSIDAMVSTITKTTNVPNYLKYTVSYADDLAIEENHLLSSNTTQKYKIRVEYRTDISASDLPSTAQSTTLYFGVEYVQADSNSVVRPYYVYTFSYTSTDMDITENADRLDLHDSYEEIASSEHPFFQKHLIVDNKISQTYFGFIYNNKVYFLLPYYVDLSIFNSNKAILQNTFGIENCDDQNNNAYMCSVTDMSVYVNLGQISANYGSNIHVEFNPLGYGGYCQGNW